MAKENPQYLIGQAAFLSGLSAPNIRHYEKEGLLGIPGRSDNSYRHFSGQDVHRLRFIRLCRAMDMSLDEVRSLLGLDLRRKADCALATVTLDGHIDHVRQRMTELKTLLQDLIELRGLCDGTGPQCRLIEALHAKAEGLKSQQVSPRGHRHV